MTIKTCLLLGYFFIFPATLFASRETPPSDFDDPLQNLLQDLYPRKIRFEKFDDTLITFHQLTQTFLQAHKEYSTIQLVFQQKDHTHYNLIGLMVDEGFMVAPSKKEMQGRSKKRKLLQSFQKDQWNDFLQINPHDPTITYFLYSHHVARAKPDRTTITRSFRSDPGPRLGSCAAMLASDDEYNGAEEEYTDPHAEENTADSQDSTLAEAGSTGQQEH